MQIVYVMHIYYSLTLRMRIEVINIRLSHNVTERCCLQICSHSQTVTHSYFFFNYDLRNLINGSEIKFKFHLIKTIYIQFIFPLETMTGQAVRFQKRLLLVYKRLYGFAFHQSFGISSLVQTYFKNFLILVQFTLNFKGTEEYAITTCSKIFVLFHSFNYFSVSKISFLLLFKN